MWQSEVHGIQIDKGRNLITSCETVKFPLCVCMVKNHEAEGEVAVLFDLS